MRILQSGSPQLLQQPKGTEDPHEWCPPPAPSKQSRFPAQHILLLTELLCAGQSSCSTCMVAHSGHWSSVELPCTSPCITTVLTPHGLQSSWLGHSTHRLISGLSALSPCFISACFTQHLLLQTLISLSYKEHPCSTGVRGCTAGLQAMPAWSPLVTQQHQARPHTVLAALSGNPRPDGCICK